MSKHSTKRRKPAKPHPDFPLWIHPSGRWCKKLKGKAYYFGKVADDPQGTAALEEWLRVKDDLLAGRPPRPKGEGLTVRELVNRYLTAQKLRADSREISPRTWRDQHETCARVIACFGRTARVVDLRPEGFERLRAAMAKTMGLRTLKTEMQRVRSLFKYGYDAALIERPIRFGPAFRNPSKRSLDKLRLDRGPKMFEPAQIRQLLDIANVRIRGMILLGVNVGFGNMDCATLPVHALDLEAGWVTHPRPKTAVPRRAPLWPEAIATLREVIAERPKPKSPAHADLVFLTIFGNPYVRLTASNSHHDNLGYVFREMLIKLGIYKRGVNFYALRHTFRTIADEVRDRPAIDHIMGHTDESMAAAYRERISDDRLRAVVDHVHGWLFAEADDQSQVDVVPFVRKRG